MKRILAVLIFICICMAVSAVDSAMFRFVPDSSIVAVETDISVLLKHPLIEKNLKNPEYMQKRLQFEKETGVKYTDFKKVGLYITSAGKVFALLQVDHGFDVLKVFTQNKVAFKKIRVSGRDILQLEKPLKNGRQVEVMTLAPGFLVAGEAGDIAAYLKEKCGNASGLQQVVKQIPAGIPVWLAFTNADPKQIKGPLSLFFTLSLVGKESKDCRLDLQIACDSKDAAKVLRNTIPFYLAMGLGMVIEDPELSAKISRSLKCKSSGSVVTAQLYLGADLCAEIGNYLAQNAAKILSRKAAEPISETK